MKKLGLVGGMGPESTIPYYHGIVYGVQKRLGRNEFPELAIESVNVFKLLGLCRDERYGELADYLLGAVHNLAAAGADFAALSANTPHIVFDELAARSPLPLVSIVAAAAEEAQRRGYKRLGLLGTEFTMNNTFFTRPFTEGGIGIFLPDERGRAYVADKIESELEFGIVKSETRAQFTDIMRSMQSRHGIEAVILGCTELPLLYEGEEAPFPFLDTLQIHVEKLIDMILADGD